MRSRHIGKRSRLNWEWRIAATLRKYLVKNQEVKWRESPHLADDALTGS